MEKAELLKSKGWSQWYNKNYWVHKQFESPGVDYTTRGLSTDEAYAFETDKESRKKTLAGMEMYWSSLSWLSKQGLKRASNTEEE